MLHEMLFFQEENYLEVIFKGELNYERLVDVFFAFTEHPEFKISMNLLFDVSEITAVCTPADIIRFFSFQDEHEDKRGVDFRIAVLCTTDTFLESIKMLASYSTFRPEAMYVFKDKEVALKWLKEG